MPTFATTGQVNKNLTKFIKIMKKYLAEMVGTMVLVLMGCGSAIFAGSTAGIVGNGVGTLGVAFAFGLAVSPWHTP